MFNYWLYIFRLTLTSVFPSPANTWARVKIKWTTLIAHVLRVGQGKTAVRKQTTATIGLVRMPTATIYKIHLSAGLLKFAICRWTSASVVLFYKNLKYSKYRESFYLHNTSICRYWYVPVWYIHMINYLCIKPELKSKMVLRGIIVGCICDVEWFNRHWCYMHSNMSNSCFSFSTHFSHRCEGGASGENCENATKVCDVLSNLNVCTNKGNCTNTPGTAKCSCPLGILTIWKLNPVCFFW